MRLFGLSSITVTTASAAGPDQHRLPRPGGRPPGRRRADRDHRGRGGRRHVTDADGWQRLDVRMLLIDPFKVLRQFLVPVAHRHHRAAEQQRRLAAVDAADRHRRRRRLRQPALAHHPLPHHRHAVPAALRAAQQEAARRRRSTGSAASTSSRRCCTAPSGSPRSRSAPASTTPGSPSTRSRRRRRTTFAASCSRSVRPRSARRRPAATARPASASYDRRARHPMTADPETVLARIDWSWLRFAPFSLSRLAVVAGAIGVLSQFGDSLPFLDEESLEERLELGARLRDPPGRARSPWSPARSPGRSSRCWGTSCSGGASCSPASAGNLRLTAGPLHDPLDDGRGGPDPRCRAQRAGAPAPGRWWRALDAGDGRRRRAA